MKLKIGVMGSAAKVNDITLKERAREVGREIARHNCILVNGATTGMPNEAAIGCREEDGFVMGISPAMDLDEHIKKWKLPYKEYDLIVYTGQGFMFRDILNIRTSDAVVFLRGSVGTLNEFTIGFEEGKVMGILENMGGISGFIDEIIQIAKKETNATVIYEKDPKKLIRKLVQEVQKKNRQGHKKSIKMVG
ncbi:LOG family protein [archaeon]|nr:LOG family protein [archaeon]MBT6041082.1 LOG family protein [Candidatus Woesearchaeota archaeon]